MIFLLFFNWDLLGIISYLLINYWSSKINCGIKSVIYNKFGDIFFMLFLAWSYSFLSIINYHPFLSIKLISLFINYIFSLFYLGIYSIPIFIIIFSKSAQLPFYSWLLNAMSAPSPISALLHSSTMVIAGVYLGIIFNDSFCLLIDYSVIASLIILLSTLLTLIFSLLKAISVSDIKSIIAYSTISQISYMFIALILINSYALFHILVHALFKSMIFLLSGSLIHIQSNYQSIYLLKINHFSLPFFLFTCVCTLLCVVAYFLFCISCVS